jgi:hypothetical protein
MTGPSTSYNVSGRDINGDGSTTNDRPVISNSRAPLNTVGVDGSYLTGGIRNVYYDQAAYNASGTLRVVNPGDVHFLIPNDANGAGMVSREVSRNSFLNPGAQFWNVAAEKAIPLPFTRRLEGSQFVFRVEAQNIGNHNNVRPTQVINVNQIGLASYQNISNARDSNEYRHLRLWAKFVF